MSEPYRNEVDGNMTIRSDGKGNFFVLMQDGSWEPVKKGEERKPTHRCKICGALWILYPPSHPNHCGPKGCDWCRDGSWSLFSPECGKCCDNVAMGEQIEVLADAHGTPLAGEIKSKPMGAVAIASDGERSAIGATEAHAIAAVKDMQETPTPAAGDEFANEVAKMDVTELRRRILVQRNWHQRFASCLDGLKLPWGCNAAMDGCRHPRDIRHIVEKLLERIPSADQPPSEGASEKCKTCGGEGIIPAMVDTATGAASCPYLGEPCPDCEGEAEEITSPDTHSAIVNLATMIGVALETGWHIDDVNVTMLIDRATNRHRELLEGNAKVISTKDARIAELARESAGLREVAHELAAVAAKGSYGISSQRELKATLAKLEALAGKEAAGE